MVARFRPQNKIELGSGGQPMVEFENEETCQINVRSGPRFASTLGRTDAK